MNKEDSYNIAFQTRNFEIKLFWQRSNYFLVLNTSLGIGFFTLKGQWFAIGLSILGALVAILWLRVNLGSKYWQARWEQRLDEIECSINRKLNFFHSSSEYNDKLVRDSFDYDNEKNIIRRITNRMILWSPSVSRTMIYLSSAFIIAWVVLVGASTYSLLCGNTPEQPIRIISKSSIDSASVDLIVKSYGTHRMDLDNYVLAKLSQHDSLFITLVKNKKGK